MRQLLVRRTVVVGSSVMDFPNLLLIMTDQERYPPPYEDEAVAKFRREQLPARESLRDGGLEFHRHYAVDGVYAESGDVVHRPVPVIARRVAD